MPRKRVVTPGVVADTVRDVDRPFATTADVADRLDVTKQAIRNHHSELSTSDELEHGKVGRQTVYWLAEDEQPEVVTAPTPPQEPRQDTPDNAETDSKGILERFFASRPGKMHVPSVALLVMAVVLPIVALRRTLDVVIDGLTNTAEAYDNENGRAREVTALSILVGLSAGVLANVLVFDPLPLAVRVAVSVLVALFVFVVAEVAGLHLTAPTVDGETA